MKTFYWGFYGAVISETVRKLPVGNCCMYDTKAIRSRAKLRVAFSNWWCTRYKHKTREWIRLQTSTKQEVAGIELRNFVARYYVFKIQ